MNLKALKFPGGNVEHMGRATHDSGSFARGRPTGILLHYTAGGHAAQRLHGRNDDKVSAHFTVDRNGKVYQCAELDQRCHHAGVSAWKGMVGLNSWFIGIEQANYGYWRKERGLPTLKQAQERGWIKAVHKDGRGGELWWEPYPEALLAAT